MYGGMLQFSPMIRASKFDENEASLALKPSSVLTSVLSLGSKDDPVDEEEEGHVHPSCVG